MVCKGGRGGRRDAILAIAGRGEPCDNGNLSSYLLLLDLPVPVRSLGNGQCLSADKEGLIRLTVEAILSHVLCPWFE